MDSGVHAIVARCSANLSDTEEKAREMAITPLIARRFIVAAVAAAAFAAAPTITALTAAPQTLADCPNGESPDVNTAQCVPDVTPNGVPNMVPNAPFQAIPGNPNIPGVNLPDAGTGTIPCTGANSGQCIGLSEEQQAQGPAPVPHSVVGGSPTVTGHIG
ncbi:hypothetical protein M2272_002777 [Mycobacterium frederiksbergense]|jgi:hypothetical protein|uniref:Intersectin-EH binding protein Ibp1 n=2 Tax=Mycolicibacterium frederiksbergense TaxID=117567 RepID=A0ABT6KZK9_9MYCO|nr:intersectin-EH binding protein Ibp1 [Mycolicibacterium frederiksbergense]MDH6196134.1 hypothetical protein [Mycolicibacterium frederiksbergense]